MREVHICINTNAEKSGKREIPDIRDNAELLILLYCTFSYVNLAAFRAFFSTSGK